MAKRNGGQSCTIVALPNEHSEVWKISSEKVPHLTILYLGEDVKNVDRIVEFVRHATNTMLSPWHLITDKRGVLGDQSADVIFFEKKYTEPFEKFREVLLQNDDIFTAYNSIEQYPSWTPHLTLGYPTTPAKSTDERVYSVLFDRIAVWTGDYEGVEIPLEEKRRPYADQPMVMSLQNQGYDFLEHYGVKGMKWGVIRDRAQNSPVGKIYNKAYKPSSDAVKAQQFMARAKLGGVRNLNNQEMQLVIQRMQLERQYKELYGERQWHTAGKKWAGKFVTDVLRDTAASWLSNPFRRGTSATDSPTRAQAWANGQQFAAAIEGPPRRRAIGS